MFGPAPYQRLRGEWSVRGTRLLSYRKMATLGASALLAGTALLEHGRGPGRGGRGPSHAQHDHRRHRRPSATNTNPRAPYCSNLSSGDTVHLLGANFNAGDTATSIQCNSDPSQPVIVFLGNNVPVSCSPLALSTINGDGTFAADQALVTGTVGPPLDTGVFQETCNPSSIGGVGGEHPGLQDRPAMAPRPTTDRPTPPSSRARRPPPKSPPVTPAWWPSATPPASGLIGVVLFGIETLPNCPTTTTTAPIACNPGTTPRRPQARRPRPVQPPPRRWPTRIRSCSRRIKAPV